jgi:hypothetical protein
MVCCAVLLLLAVHAPTRSAEAADTPFELLSTRPDADPVQLRRLQSRLIELAEARLGPRDASKRIYEPKFHPDGPHLRNTPSLDGAFAELSPGARASWRIAVFELAHETVHLLNPSVGKTESVFEEGIAVEFSVVAQIALGQSTIVPADDRYQPALQAVRRLPDDPFVIARRIRDRHGSLKGISVDDLQQAAPGLDRMQARLLLGRFHDTNDRTPPL